MHYQSCQMEPPVKQDRAFLRILSGQTEQSLYNMPLVHYIASLPASRLVLWSFVIWWAVMASYYFTPDLRLWTTSLGIGVIVGFALMLSTGPISLDRFRNRFWESVRLFVCPFMVSSFSALVAGNSFVLVFSPSLRENTIAVTAIAVFFLLVRFLNFMVIRGEQ